MRRVDWRHDGRQLHLRVAIFPSASAANATHSIEVNGLIDTGATTSGLRLDLVAKLALKKRDRAPVQTANGTVLMDRYLARIGLFPDPASDEPKGGLFVFEREFLIQGLARDFSHEMLIGMDLISKCDFTVLRDARASLAFD